MFELLLKWVGSLDAPIVGPRETKGLDYPEGPAPSKIPAA